MASKAITSRFLCSSTLEHILKEAKGLIFFPVEGLRVIKNPLDLFSFFKQGTTSRACFKCAAENVCKQSVLIPPAPQYRKASIVLSRKHSGLSSQRTQTGTWASQQLARVRVSQVALVRMHLSFELELNYLLFYTHARIHEASRWILAIWLLFRRREIAFSGNF